MNCNDFKIIEPPNERCCTDGADIRTESSDCSSCRTISSIKETDNSDPFIVTQCIWKPKKEIEETIEEIPQECTVPKKKIRRSKDSTPLIEPYDYNLPELDENIILPLHDKSVAALAFGEIMLVSFLTESPLKCSEDLFNFKSEKYVGLGGFCMNIERDGHNIILYSASEFTCNGKATRGSIYSLCDTSLNVIEEKRTESYIDENGEKKEKGIHLIKESIDQTNDNKHIIAFRTFNENKIISKYYAKIKINVTGALLPDGVNFIVLRHLVILKYVGTFETWTINMKGNICRSEYIFKPVKMLRVNSVYTEVVQVQRNITSLTDEPEIIKMYFLTTGHLIRHTWENYPFIIHLNPFSTIPPTGFIVNSFETWQQHIELVSNYLDAKDNAQSKLKTYLNDKPEVRCMIKDYVALLLQLKPASILGLTIEYFMNLHGDAHNVTEESDEDSDSDSFFNTNLEDSDETDEEEAEEDDKDLSGS